MIHNHIGIRKIFHYVSKVIRDCRVLALLRYVIGPGNLALLSQPIRLITKVNLDVVSRVFPPFRQWACFEFEFSLAPLDILPAVIVLVSQSRSTLMPEAM